ncbi:MAG TPA: large conductance mechanosensitive channel protein MscL [Bacilli bacterium]|nr:large conductance mechanosensitive channel protein MscL [Bacilli bacterium]HPS18812.1 large conductance mechanosensitive channel protein MscL [Bacilli bacterium]
MKNEKKKRLIKPYDPNKKTILKDFKAFISRGNVMQLAVGVIIGAAFSAIVSALVNHILMPIISLAVNGGLDSFYTILPNSVLADVQDGTVGVLANDGNWYASLSKIDWGLLINAVINFVLIAIILFVLIKTFAAIQKANDERKAKWLEAHYQKHPELRPAPVDPGIPEPTDHEILKEILNVLKEPKNTETKK